MNHFRKYCTFYNYFRSWALAGGRGKSEYAFAILGKKYTFLFSGQFSRFIGAFFSIWNTSTKPKVRGTADVGWRSLFHLPINTPDCTYSLTTLSSHVSTDRRAVTDMNGKTRMLRCAPFLCRLRQRKCCMLGAPSSQPCNGPPTRTTSG